MPEVIGDFTPRAPDHMPSLVEWTSFLLSFLFLLGTFYVVEAYRSYHDLTEPARLPAAQRLEQLQRASSPLTAQPIEIWVRRQLADADVENYRTGLPDGRGERSPFVLLCSRDCADSAHRVKMALAYGIHYDRSGGADNWDFWFAPIKEGKWVFDPIRLLLRINPSQSDHWGIVDGNWTDLNVDFSENEIADLPDLGATSLAGYLDQIVEDQDVQAANRVDAPVDSLTLHSGFAEGPVLDTPPGWRSIGVWVEDMRAGLPDFISESSGQSFAQWLGEHVFDLLWFLGVVAVGVFCVVKGWWSVGIYGYHWLLDGLKKERLKSNG